jgi:polyhydroxyalkanoate synthesis regulator phasin
MFGLTTRRRHDAETTRLHDVVRKLHGERDEARKERDAFQSAARTAAEKYVIADATNRRLDGRVRELRRRLEDTTEGAYVTQLETRLQALAMGTSRWMLAVWSRDRCIGILQKQLDATRTNLVASQARVAELHEQLTKAEAAADPRPVHGGARYPQPFNELRAAKAHAAALDRRLSEVTAANANCKCGAA